MSTTIDVFFSYSHKDEALRDELAVHLKLLERKGMIRSWHDRRIGVGDDWRAAIDANLEKARAILLLVSADFLASDYCYDVEMKRALARHDAGDAVILPVILRDCTWTHAPFAKLQALPRDARPVTSWPNRDEAWTNVVSGIEAAVTRISVEPIEFRREILSLLALQGWQMTPEKVVGHKKIDAYGERLDALGKTQRLAVECKAASSPLTKADVAQIYADYIALVEANAIDIILLVTHLPLAPSGTTYVQDLRAMRHLTYAQLLSSIIEFSGYVRGLHADFQRGQLAATYVPQDAEQIEGPLEQWLLQWIQSDDTRPIAILGGYGIGKTTIARRIAHLAAQRHQEDNSSRIPVLISLADIATDQDLNGLLGRQFTSLSVVSNYNYRLFMALNERGRFLFILDGFDEMKKTMSWESLRYNLEQLNQLVVPKSKVILLGRPTAFLTDEEHQEALHGKRRILSADRQIPGWPDYREIELKPFSRPQIEMFVERALTAKASAADGTADEDNRINNLSAFLGRLRTPRGRRLIDLASRPVQLKMLVEILPAYRGEIDGLTVAILYQEFIDLVIRRELSKRTRQAFGVDARRRFARDLAYWMWQNEAGTAIESHQIPDSLFTPFVPENGDAQSVKRDLLSGCFLERKPPRGYYSIFHLT